MSKKRVVVAMSGGVDSSMAAALLKRQGYDVAGAIMEIFDESLASAEGSRHACFGPGEREDIEDARMVAGKLNIPLYTIDLKEKYRKNIIDSFIKEYLAGKTPNPCIKCNHEMKFGAITAELKKRGIDFDYFATGHYARIEPDDDKNRFLLKKAVDKKKDQSYFLYRLSQKQLAHIIFPLGELKKEQVRKLAQELFPTIGRKPESQDFIAGGYRQLFENAVKPGPILNSRGEQLGEHQGIAFYTIGQRRGIGISHEQPLFVIAKDSQKNAIIVGEKEELLGSRLSAANLNWLSCDRPHHPMQVKARIRFQHQEAAAEVTPRGDDKVLVEFKVPQMAVTPGQSVVFYQGDIVLGGGIIEADTPQ